MSSILIALRALPELLKLLNALGVYLKEKLGDNPGKFIAETHETFTALKNAKTPEEKQTAARAISGLISRL
jgi:hypothetical protein